VSPSRLVAVAVLACCALTAPAASASGVVPSPEYVRCYDVTVTVVSDSPVLTVCSPV
jgi:hypothetical protein